MSKSISTTTAQQNDGGLDQKAITMSLNGNIMVLNATTGMWTMESSDLDVATSEIEKLVDDKETLALSLSTSLSQIESLQKEVVEVNELKALILEMVCECLDCR